MIDQAQRRRLFEIVGEPLPPELEQEQSDPPPSDEPPDIGESEGPTDIPPPASETDTVKGKHPNAPKLPKIRIGVKMTEVTDLAERALGALGKIYTRARRLVHVIRDWSAPKWLKIPDGSPVIAVLGDAALREMMSAAADWEKIDRRSMSWIPSPTPEWAPKALKERGQWSFPVLDGISEAPVLRSDGTVHDVPGYDPESRYIFAPGRTVWPRVKRNPTQDDARAAYDELAEPFCDFPFVTDSDRAAAISLILSIVGRSAIAGPVPGYEAKSNTPGAGKGLVIDVCSIIATSREASKMAPTRNEEENRKRMLPIAMSGAPIVCFDNIEGAFGSETLAYALTTGAIRERKLGLSEDSDIPLSTVFAITGNNVQLVGDLGRRIIPIRIDPKVEHPEDRTGFRYPDLKGHVAAERPRLYVAALTLLTAYIAAGRHKHPKPAKGSFEAWDALVRGAVVWAGGHDLDDGVQELRKTGDHDLERLRTLIAAWLAFPTLQDATAVQILDTAKSNPTLQAVIDAYKIKDQAVDSSRLGNVLAKLRDRPCGRHRIERCDTVAHGGGSRWRVAEIDPVR